MNTSINQTRSQKIATPWGQSHYVHNLNDEGTVFKVGTSEHGGIGVSPSVKMPAALAHAGFSSCCGTLWFEEDLGWSAVAVALPNLFDRPTREAARNTLRDYLPKTYAAHFGCVSQNGVAA